MISVLLQAHIDQDSDTHKQALLSLYGAETVDQFYRITNDRTKGLSLRACATILDHRDQMKYITSK